MLAIEQAGNAGAPQMQTCCQHIGDYGQLGGDDSRMGHVTGGGGVQAAMLQGLIQFCINA